MLLVRVPFFHQGFGQVFREGSERSQLVLSDISSPGLQPLQGRIVAVHTPWMKYLQDGRRIDSNPYEHEKRVSFSVPQALELVDV